MQVLYKSFKKDGDKMRYLVLKAQKKEKKKDTPFIYGDGDIFFFISVLSRVEEIGNYNVQVMNCLFYAKDGENFKIASDYNSIVRDYDNFEERSASVFQSQLPCESTYSWNRDGFDIFTVLDTDNEDDLYLFLEENKIIPFEKYQATGSPKVLINNNSSLNNIAITRLMEYAKISQIKSIDYSCIGYTYQQLNVNQNEEEGNYYSYSEYALYATKDFFEWYKKYFIYGEDNKYTSKRCAVVSFSRLINNNKATRDFYYVSATNKSVKITKVKLTISFKNETLIFDFNDAFAYDYTLGEKIVCVKKLKKGDKEVSPFDMFNINSQTIRNPQGIYVFEESENVQEFFINNYTFFERCGLIRFISEMKMSLKLKALLVLYLCLIYEYPVIELLVKMGHSNLIECIFKKLLNSPRKDMIRDNVLELEQLINRDTTKGTMALRIPSYIGDYLKARHSSLRDYLFWRDIFEITHISKENFEEFINLPERVIINAEIFEGSSFDSWRANDWYSLGLQDIVKYNGYSLKKTIKYCFNRSEDGNNYQSFTTSVNVLKDTLCMAEELDFDLEPYPDNLNQIHNQLSMIKREKVAELSEKKVKNIADECSAVMEKVFSSNAADLPTKAMEELTYVFPSSQMDFTQEGQNQHNCVAGYFSRVQRGDCVIFFVRRKEDVKSSYITAEIRKDGIAQVMYSNNRPVSHESMDYKYCRYIANKILRAINADEIHAIHKVLKD